MRIRKQFAGAFVILCLIAGCLGLAPNKLPRYKQSDKVLHFITFFLITLCFYWILETNRRRNLQFTLITCTFLLGIGSELLQGFLPNGRDFDAFDILSNILGSLSALGLCTWYHKRMLERKRRAKTYHIVPGGEGTDNLDLDLDLDPSNSDIELGEGVGRSTAALPQQEIDVTSIPPQSIEEQLDQWDENVADDWNDEEGPPGTSSGSGDGEGQKTPTSSNADELNVGLACIKREE